MLRKQIHVRLIEFKDKNKIMNILDSLHDEMVRFKIVNYEHIYFSICNQTSEIKEVHLFCSESLKDCYSIYKITNDFKELHFKFSDTGNLNKDLDNFELEIIDFYYNTRDIIVYGSTRISSGYGDDFVIVIPSIEKISILQQ